MARLEHDSIYITDETQINFFKFPLGWYWNLWSIHDGDPAYPTPHKPDGPHETLEKARIDAWQKAIEGKATTTTLYIQEVGYAWKKLLENRAKID